ncbi:MAG: uracil-DNA glycosylase family protein [Longicatena sp.]|uniref:uracil-DNA glycosylase family protein n=1 Tax=Anaerorhabdus sp. TaxID=1872524 RepID=UPI002FCA92E8
MIKSISKCKKCGLCYNQKPLLDNLCKTCDVMWIGLSAKKVEDVECSYPLSNDTNTGEIIAQIEEKIESRLFYKTNLVKCLPLGDNNKIRYPNKIEIEYCMPNLLDEIIELEPKIIFLLGNLVESSVIDFLKCNSEYKYILKKYNFVKLYHPSYIYIYKRRQINNYIDNIVEMVKKI